MQLQGIEKGDIVRVDGRLCYVAAKMPGVLRVTPCHGSSYPRDVKARDVEELWRRRRPRLARG